MSQRILFNSAILACSALSLLAWAQPAVSAPAAAPKPLPAAVANAPLINADRQPTGELTIYEGKGGLLMRVEATGLTPGWHAMHFHQKGTCEDKGFELSGSHMAGDHPSHGVLTEGPHLGDLPNVYAAADGSVHADVIAPGLALKGKNGLLDADGTALIIHAQPDDYQSQPSGIAGARIACGVVKAVSGK